MQSPAAQLDPAPTVVGAAPAVLPTPVRLASLRRRAALALAAVTAVLSAAVLTAAPAWAAPAVTIQNADGTAVASTTGPTTMTVSGTGFQSIPGGFGGIYVMFGWVADPAGAWAPSQGGVSGQDYRYAADTASIDNEGFQRFVAFPGSDTAAAANGGELAADGTWSVTMTVPAPQLELVGLDDVTEAVDCTVVTCGILTIGAHGVANGANETFTPITFADPGAPSDADGPADGPTAAETAAVTAEATEPAAQASTAPAQTAAPAVDSTSGGVPAGPVAVGVGLVLALAAGAVALVRRRRAAQAAADAEAEPIGPADPPPGAAREDGPRSDPSGT
ncbi:MAG TPA: hypothetical protein VGC57_13025 [Cellulomonas sp.]